MICDFLSNMCGKQFKSQKTLTQYNRDVHIEDDIPCSLCDKTFRTKKHLANQKFNKRTEKESLQFDVISEWPWMQLSYHVSEQFECTEKESRWENCECYSTVGIQVCLFVVWFQNRYKRKEKSHGYLVSDRKMRTPNAAENNKKRGNIWTAFICHKVLYIHCFSVLCFHIS